MKRRVLQPRKTEPPEQTAPPHEPASPTDKPAPKRGSIKKIQVERLLTRARAV